MNEVYLIGEIGQNHNGSVDIAKLIIDSAAREVEEPLFNLKLKGMNAVKLTKRDLNYELTTSEMNRLYNSPHSFGKTYGDHRRFLELDNAQHYDLYQYAKSKGLEFVETLCAISCLEILNYFVPDYLKVASRDLTNEPLLEEMAKTEIPIILSTGMGGKKELDQALTIITKYHEKIGVLHCVSQYPTEPKNVNLNTIRYLMANYGKYTIGYSDHTIGISAPIAAAAMGARIIEKHITLDRRMKGTDQAGSLGPDGLNRMVRDIRLLEQSFGQTEIFISEGAKEAKTKLERSLAWNGYYKKGEIVTENMLCMLSPGTGLAWNQRHKIIGKALQTDVIKNEILNERQVGS
ncbi:N-acetylneuraminate synthase family protein [Lunatimonas salinarum]|uniref:N-acetylneuraminate synthase family protein n=1 Tax=Lunatimonas salinarum TaxID=1774590 RepID=UPI001ADF8316|nr:N-acetylneuraminate synthase family protein [Lunatimonas salinarum]